MLKKTIKYVDYNGVEREEDFYFDLSKAEITEMELSRDGGMSNLIQKIVNAKDMPSLIKIFKQLILKSYGVKSADGRRFIKSEQLSTEFTQTPAYSELFMELATDEKAAANFINAIVPQEVSEKSKELAAKN
jgi:hypothetical protein